MSAPRLYKIGRFFSLFMQNLRFFGAETAILTHFQLLLCIIYHLKHLERQGFRVFFRYFPKGICFSEKLEFFGLFVK